MITAIFNDKMDYTIAYGLWQWDYGQVLRVKGLDFDQISIEVHFSLSPDNTDSLVTIGVVKDVDYQSTIVSDGEEYTVNETATVLDVVIPKDMLWNNIKKNYTIYVFLLSTNEESGETLKRIIMPVKVKPKPIYSVTPEDEELFHRVVEEVNTFAETAKEHSNISKSYAVGNTETRENEDIDNAKYYAEQAFTSSEEATLQADNAEQSANSAKESEENAELSANKAKEYETSSKTNADNAKEYRDWAYEYKDNAQEYSITSREYRDEAENAKNIALQASIDTGGVRDEVNRTKTQIDEIVNTIDNQLSNVTESASTSAQAASQSAQSAEKSELNALESAQASKAEADKSKIYAEQAQGALGGMTFVGFSMNDDGHVLVTNSDRLGTTSFELTQNGHMEVTY